MKHAIFDKNNVIYTVGIKQTQPENNDDIATFDQILSTFKFSDSISPTDTPSNLINVAIPSDWITYDKNFSDAHFFFRYPSSFSVEDGDFSSGEIYLMSKDNAAGPIPFGI